MLGRPFADAKQQPMSSTSDFLGLSRDVSQALCNGLVRFWPRTRIVDKIEAMLSEAESGDCLHPGQASKLYGILNFFSKDSMGQPMAIKEGQHESTTKVTKDLRGNFRYVKAIIRARPERQLPVLPLPCVIASWLHRTLLRSLPPEVPVASSWSGSQVPRNIAKASWPTSTRGGTTSGSLRKYTSHRSR